MTYTPAQFRSLWPEFAAPSWAPWASIEDAVFGVEPEDGELVRKVTGRQTLPTSPVSEVWAIVGRGGGKSRWCARLAVYFAGDTGLFGDMRLIGEVYEPVIGFLPIGDLFTMGIEDSIAAVKLIEPKKVLPAHYNTWPPIEVDAKLWAIRVGEETDSQSVVLEVGQSLEL